MGPTTTADHLQRSPSPNVRTRRAEGTWGTCPFQLFSISTEADNPLLPTWLPGCPCPVPGKSTVVTTSSCCCEMEPVPAAGAFGVHWDTTGLSPWLCCPRLSGKACGHLCHPALCRCLSCGASCYQGWTDTCHLLSLGRRKVAVAKQNYRCAGCGIRTDPGECWDPEL